MEHEAAAARLAGETRRKAPREVIEEKGGGNSKPPARPDKGLSCPLCERTGFQRLYAGKCRKCFNEMKGSMAIQERPAKRKYTRRAAEVVAPHPAGANGRASRPSPLRGEGNVTRADGMLKQVETLLHDWCVGVREEARAEAREQLLAELKGMKK